MIEQLRDFARQDKTLQDKIVSALNPIAVYKAISNKDSAKNMVIDMRSRLKRDLEPLLSLSQQISHSLDEITASLDLITTYAIDELGAPPQSHPPLRVLLEYVAPSTDFPETKIHAAILEDLEKGLDAASKVMKHTATTLLGVDAQLESARDAYAIPGLVMRDEELEDVMDAFESAARGLRAARREVGLIEGG